MDDAAEQAFATAQFDQLHADALRRLRGCKGFILTVHDDDEIVTVCGGYVMGLEETVAMFIQAHDVACKALRRLPRPGDD